MQVNRIFLLPTNKGLWEEIFSHPGESSNSLLKWHLKGVEPGKSNNFLGPRAIVRQEFSAMERIRVLWEQELGVDIEDGLCQDALENIQRCSASTRLHLVRFKVIYRLHYTKARLHEIFPGVSQICDWCLTEEAPHLHSYVVLLPVYSIWNFIRNARHRIETQPTFHHIGSIIWPVCSW